jgi:hypothetical protein
MPVAEVLAQRNAGVAWKITSWHFECKRLWVLKNSLTRKGSNKTLQYEALQLTISAFVDIFHP